jgi:diguanylate cyclase (GGDEF)-like protein
MDERDSALGSDGRERRIASERIAWHGPQPDEMWRPARKEVVTQFFTRYLFFVLGLLFFTAVDNVKPVLVGVNGILLIYGIYFVLVSLLFLQSMKGMSFRLERLSMLLDMFMVTFSVIHDPYQVPPSALAYLMVIFGNGLRYGMRPFLEALVAAMIGMALSFAFRYRLAGFEVSAADVFFGVFWVTITVYAYVLLGRINVQYRMLDFRSRCDILTGLLNRKGLSVEVNKLLSKSDKDNVAVLFADLNSFKLINDKFGHAAGDRVLTEFAQILKDSAETDLVGRWGGDEFVAAFRGGENEVRDVMDRIRRRLQLWSMANGLPVSVSLGYSMAPRDGEDLVTLLSVADIALYQNKAVPMDKEQMPYVQAPETGY